MRCRLLRLLLLFSAIAWGVSVIGVFFSWPTAVTILQQLGLKEVSYDPMLDYWLRMASGAFFLVGVIFFLAAMNPRKYAVLLPVFGWLMVAEGAILLFHGIRLGLPALPFYADTLACLLAGSGILYLRNDVVSK
ncbi:MAG: hypothetical protein JWM68_1939 [Verrucomicrobiales bacterium]|nr:hypothetical protein [Verrucomicrobiales bacterium]